MIGLIDSGVGGLSVLAAIEATLPHEDCIYYADSAHFPYGDKSPIEVLRYCMESTAFLLSKGISLLVIACHTASIAAYETLQKNFPIPIVGMVEPTIRSTKAGKAALLSTKTTIESGVYQKMIPDLTCLTCPELIKKIEKGDPEIQQTTQKCLTPIIGKKVDTLILGCTHFAFAFHEIEEELDLETRLFNPALAVASEVALKIKEPKPKTHHPKHTIFVSGEIAPIEAFLKKNPLSAPYQVLSLTE